MARTISDINAAIVAELVTQFAAVGITINPTNWSAVNVLRLVCYTVAVCQWTLETLFDLHKQEVTDTITNTKPHRVQWYATMAKLFQYGDNLVPDQDYYDNTGQTQSAIDAKKIVSYAAAIEISRGLRLKVATTSGGDLAPLTTTQLNAFKAYMAAIKDAGVRLYIDSQSADSLKLSLKIYYNALILDGNGARLDGTANTPVQDAINNFLKNQPFNGRFVLAFLVDALQKVDGVVIPHVVSAQARYGVLPYANVDVEYQPDAGYLRIINPTTDLTLQFIAHEPI